MESPETQKSFYMDQLSTSSSNHQWQVTEDGTLLEAISRKNPHQSQRTLRHWIQYGRLRVNGSEVNKANQPLKSGDWLYLGPWPKFLRGPSFLGKTIPILFEDKDMIVLDKPCHLLSVSDEARTRTHLFGIVKQSYPDAFVVHRLDAKTQGLIIFGKNRNGGEKVKTMLEEKLIRRRYMAICYGQLEAEEIEWEDLLHEDAHFHVHVVDSQDPRSNRAKFARTKVRLLEQGKSLCLLEFELDTGRKHQIRAQAAHHGHSVFSDDRYHCDSKKIGSKETMALLSWQLSWPSITISDHNAEEEASHTSVPTEPPVWQEITTSYLSDFEKRWARCRNR